MDILDFISSWPVWLQWLVASLILFTMIWSPFPVLFIRFIKWIIRSLRPEREGWVAQAIPTPPESDIYRQPESDPNNAWHYDRGRWTNGKQMEIGDWFSLELGKPRALSQIVVISEGARFPKKLNFYIKDKRENEWVLEKEAEISLNYKGNTTFYHRFKKKKKVFAIKLEIAEPTLEPIHAKGRSPAWAIYNIDLKEYKLFGRLWEYKI